MKVKKIDNIFIENNKEFASILLNHIYEYLSNMSLYYPDFKTWIDNKVMKGIHTGERSILLEYSGEQIAGIAILKDTVEEKKLCCLRVLPQYEGSGIGLKLFERAFEELKTRMPLLSVAQENSLKFKKIFDYYGFTLEEKYPDYYRPQNTEFSFNGLLYIPKNDLF